MKPRDQDRRYDAWCTTDFESEKYTFVWTISKFNSRPEKIGEFLKSKEFTVNGPGDKNSKWEVWLYPKGIDEQNKDLISMYLHNTTEDFFNEDVINAKCVLSTIDAYNAKQTMDEIDLDTDWGCWLIVKKEKTYLLPPNDSLTLFFDITMIEEGKESIEFAEPGSMSLALSSNYHHKKLAEDFTTLLSSKHQSDITFKCEEKLFDCHQIILASRSHVFKTMFESNMKEKLTGSVEIKDMDPEVFEDVLKYIYSGEAPNIDDHTEKLLAAADRYQLKELMEFCEMKLCSKLDVTNCIGLLVLGDFHHASSLKAAALKFVSKNMNRVDSLDWKKRLIANPTLMAEVLELVLTKVD